MGRVADDFMHEYEGVTYKCFVINDSSHEGPFISVAPCDVKKGIKTMEIPYHVDGIPVLNVVSAGTGDKLWKHDIKKIIINNNIEFLGDYVFRGFRNLKEVEFEENSSLKSIGEYAFFDCRAIKKIELPDSVCDLKTNIFKDCSSLESLHFGKNVKSYSSAAYYRDQDCTSMKSLTVSPGNPYIYSKENCIIDRDGNRILCGCCGSVIPDDKAISVIFDRAFEGVTFDNYPEIPER